MYYVSRISHDHQSLFFFSLLPVKTNYPPETGHGHYGDLHVINHELSNAHELTALPQNHKINHHVQCCYANNM